MMTKPAGLSFPVSNNVARMQPSSTLAAMQAAEALRAAGANVVDFGAGEPDFDTPDNIKQAANEAMRAGHDAPCGEIRGVKFRNNLRQLRRDAQLKHLVKVAIIELATPTNTQCAAAHQSIDGPRVKTVG